MKVSKLIVVCIFSFSLFNVTLFAQLNPVNDLSFDQFYWYGSNCPSYNCFELSWKTPDPSEDTLMAYHIYRNDEPWIYTNDTIIKCDGWIPCNYPDFYNPFPPFYVVVKAVYNRDSLESAATDTVYVEDLAIHAEQPEKEKISLLKNPVVSGEKIPILMPDVHGDFTIQIGTMTGRIIHEYKVKNNQAEINSVPTDKLSSGCYIIILKSQKVRTFEKVIVF
ncbi:MAG: T9SS type A sorting domain-containing protein [Bacteroidales bacterium]